jgi:hypothetical protein
MKRHLSPEEISEALIGGVGRQDVDEHLQSCPACLSEATKLHAAILNYAGAAREWSRELDSGEFRVAPVREAKKSGWRVPKIVVGLAAAMVVLLVAFGVFFRRHQTAPTEALNSVSDEVLMQQIDDGVSRRAPEAMEPLVRAISENTGGASVTPGNSDIHSQGQVESSSGRN